jgi:hypothetical protein
MVCINFGDFPNNPLSFSFNSLCEKMLFLEFLTFQELRDSKKGKVKKHNLEFRDEKMRLSGPPWGQWAENETWCRGKTSKSRHQYSFAIRASDAIRFLVVLFIMT